ncbi:hypothetical protein J1P26_24995 [Neobacillus sp. MM2021_6]|uniref:hypothetical protein n=1 Tax=Bacillaceae TaxID=186817 RepID=UPI00140B3EC5|nr:MULTISPECIES: hypothetical protein [Bacillaceae]MBO0962933.1 hypothetical protein [Neobacillus sp. MM2021_6]NHC21211.1 hypothetical protein [Bacillus sp. MM2020_4]
MIEQVSIVDDQGNYLEPLLVFPYDVLPVNLVRDPVPEGLYQPRWDGAKWVEGLSEDELRNRQLQNIPISEIDKIREESQMNALAIMELTELLLGGM